MSQQPQQQHALQPQQGVYKAPSSGAVTAQPVQWMNGNPSGNHQVIILHSTAEEPQARCAPGDTSGMASIIQAAEQGQIIGQHIWETQSGEYPNSTVQLADGTIIPGHPQYSQDHQQAFLVVEGEGGEGTPGSAAGKDGRKPAKKRRKRTLAEMLAMGYDPTKLEDNSAQVSQKLEHGCDCADENCFRGMNPDTVYRHRLNIAELSKHEHDMYLMGVTMACLSNPEETQRHKERKRLRAKYVFQGKEVCLDAFLYLENCTHYQLKRIRKHVMTHGVTPRVHGNHGKRPHNTFPLDIYKHACDFVASFLEQYGHKGDRRSKSANKKSLIYLPHDVTRKKMHDAYVEFMKNYEPVTKAMSYSAFRFFIKEQFAHVRFPKIDKVPVIEVSGVTTVKPEVEEAPSGPIDPPSIDLDQKHVVTSVLPDVPAEVSVPYSVPHHHQSTTYTVSTRQFSAPDGAEYDQGATYQTYSIAM